MTCNKRKKSGRERHSPPLLVAAAPPPAFPRWRQPNQALARRITSGRARAWRAHATRDRTAVVRWQEKSTMYKYFHHIKFHDNDLTNMNIMVFANCCTQTNLGPSRPGPTDSDLIAGFSRTFQPLSSLLVAELLRTVA